jgi:hypothetical protein
MMPVAAKNSMPTSPMAALIQWIWVMMRSQAARFWIDWVEEACMVFTIRWHGLDLTRSM